MVARKLNNQITWFRNLDGEAFSVGGNIDATGPVDVVVADADGDGDLDIIFTSRDSGELIATVDSFIFYFLTYIFSNLVIARSGRGATINVLSGPGPTCASYACGL